MALPILILFIFVTPPLTATTMDNLFDTLEPKATPLYSCTGWTDGIKYRVPSKMNCDLVDTTKESHVINITLWWQSLTTVRDMNVTHLKRKTLKDSFGMVLLREKILNLNHMLAQINVG